MFKCECGKAYLSPLALSNHIKSKHPSHNSSFSEISLNILFKNYNNQYVSNIDEIQRKRGRPKKKFNVMNNNLEINYQKFFQKDHRQKEENEIFEITDLSLLNKIFHEVYDKKKESEKTNECFKIEEHIFYNFILNKDKASISKNSRITSDEIFLKYLTGVSNSTNKEYFIFILKFILIFRDCINKYKNIELENSIYILKEDVPENIKEFTQYYDAEQIPELCNEFLTEYLTEEYFQLKNEHLSDFIEIIQHFSHWLYENNYSSSRLLVNN
jgi:hypothetical protein